MEIEMIDPPTPMANVDVLNHMAAHGGSFVRQLAEAWLRADAGNSAKLMKAFRAYYLDYQARYYVAERIGFPA